MANVPKHLERTAGDVKAAFRSVVKDSRIGDKDLAFRLGVHRMNVSHWGNPEKLDRHLPAYVIPEICGVTQDFRVLEVLEEAAGREGTIYTPRTVSVTPGNPEAGPALVQTVRNALQALANKLESDLPADSEHTKVIGELNDAIRECTELKRWLMNSCCKL